MEEIIEYYENYQDQLYEYDEDSVNGLLNLISKQREELNRLKSCEELSSLFDSIILSGNIEDLDLQYLANKYHDISYLGASCYYLFYFLHNLQFDKDRTSKRVNKKQIKTIIDEDIVKLLAKLYNDLCQYNLYLHVSDHEKLAGNKLRIKSSGTNKFTYRGGYGITCECIDSNTFTLLNVFNEDEYRCSVNGPYDRYYDVEDNQIKNTLDIKDNDSNIMINKINSLVLNYQLDKLSYQQLVEISLLITDSYRDRATLIYGF